MVRRDTSETEKENKVPGLESGMKMLFGRKLRPIWLAALAVLLGVAACSTSSEQASTCLDRLNDREYASVAEDETCSNYERGSAELGLAGFEFSKFIITAALDSFPSALGLTEQGCAESGTESLDKKRSFFSSYQRRYMRSQYWTRWIYNVENESQPLYDAEIAMFGAAGEIVAQTYCEVDSDLNGAITSTELSNFTLIQVPQGNISVEVLTDYLFVVKNGVPWLVDLSGGLTTSWECRESPDYSSVWERLSGGPTTIGDACVALFDGADNIALVVSVDSLPRMFVTGTTTDDIEAPFNLLSGALQKGVDIAQDLDTIGIVEGSSLRTTLETQVQRIDNGGLDGGFCAGGNAVVINFLGVLVSLLETLDHASSYDDAALATHNLFDLTLLEAVLGADFACEGEGCATVRLIFAADDSTEGHTDLYKLANDDIQETLGLSAHLVVDTDTGEPRVTEAGDFDITFEELLCLQ